MNAVHCVQQVFHQLKDAAKEVAASSRELMGEMKDIGLAAES